MLARSVFAASLLVVGFGSLVACASAPEGNTTEDALESAPPPRQLTVMTLNLLHGFPNFDNIDQRTQSVADEITKEHPDFVLLQEAGKAGQTALTPNRAKILADMTGYQWTWRKASGVPFFFEEGPGVLSRWPITQRDGIDLPHKTHLGLAGRVLSSVVATTPLGPIRVASTHLGSTDGPSPDKLDDSDTADQAKAAYDWLVTQRGDMPIFLAGDFNSTPDYLAMRFLRGEADYGGERGTLTDSWLQFNASDPGFTYPSDQPTQRIDYIYSLPGNLGAATVVSCKHVLDAPVDGIYPSDHVGVLCQFTIP